MRPPRKGWRWIRFRDSCFAPNTDTGFLHAILAAVEDDTHNPGVLCIGWGQAEPSWTRESLVKINEALAAAVARGITVF
jgi:kumamolisin